ncbi:hypothetical protein, partial [Campylobacter sp.]|uniref:hypothetical protein n=1 Tax=Campylobacter sp. TaxID=205 RepID=UPI0025BE20F0
MEKESGEVFLAKIINEILNHILDKGSITYKKLRAYINLDEKMLFKNLKYDKNDAENTKLVEFKKLIEFKKALGEHSLNKKELDEISTHITL